MNYSVSPKSKTKFRIVKTCKLADDVEEMCKYAVEKSEEGGEWIPAYDYLSRYPYGLLPKTLSTFKEAEKVALRLKKESETNYHTTIEVVKEF